MFLQSKTMLIIGVVSSAKFNINRQYHPDIPKNLRRFHSVCLFVGVIGTRNYLKVSIFPGSVESPSCPTTYPRNFISF